MSAVVLTISGTSSTRLQYHELLELPLKPLVAVAPPGRVQSFMDVYDGRTKIWLGIEGSTSELVHPWVGLSPTSPWQNLLEILYSITGSQLERLNRTQCLFSMPTLDGRYCQK